MNLRASQKVAIILLVINILVSVLALASPEGPAVVWHGLSFVSWIAFLVALLLC